MADPTTPPGLLGWSDYRIVSESTRADIDLEAYDAELERLMGQVEKITAEGLDALERALRTL